MQISVQEGPGDLEFWWRPAAGFELRTDLATGSGTTEPGATWLVPKVGERGGRFAEPIRPRLAPSDLDEFANLRTEADVLTYASEHGWLGELVQARTPDGSVVRAERTEPWLREAAAVKQTLDLINGALRLRAEPSELDRRTLRDAVRHADFEKPTTAGARSPITLPESALALAAFRIESRLGNLVAFRIHPQPRGAISYVPRNLLGAIYLELARRVTARTPRWRNCEFCGRLFLASRRDARYHSDTCRSNARHHRRKANE